MALKKKKKILSEAETPRPLLNQWQLSPLSTEVGNLGKPSQHLRTPIRVFIRPCRYDVLSWVPYPPLYLCTHRLYRVVSS